MPPAMHSASGGPPQQLMSLQVPQRAEKAVSTALQPASNCCSGRYGVDASAGTKRMTARRKATSPAKRIDRLVLTCSSKVYYTHIPYVCQWHAAGRFRYTVMAVHVPYPPSTVSDSGVFLCTKNRE